MAIIKKEPQFNLNWFNESDTKIGLQALAYRILNLIFQEKGTITNCYDMGIGIETYLFEFLTNDLISELNMLITTQISNYLPDVDLISVDVSEGNPDVISTNKSISIKIELDIDNEIYEVLYVITSRKDGILKVDAYI
jgi:hypothetical protein